MQIDTTTVAFGDVNVGNSASVDVTLTNGGADPFGPINIFGGAPPSAEFNAFQSCQGATLAAGATCTVTYTFAPTGPVPFTDSSAFTISETVNAADGEDFTVSLSGTGVNPITAVPTSIDFGAVAVGTTTPPMGVTVTNTSDEPFGPINIFGGAPPTTEFTASQNCQGNTLAAGGTCTVSYTFSPTSIGSFSDTSSFTISGTASEAAGTGFVVALAGEGIHPISVSPSAVDFGDVNVGNSSSAAVTVTNNGADPFGPINIFGGEPPSAEFGASQDCQGATLAAGATCTVTYSFSPTAPGPSSDASSFTISDTLSQADGADFVISLSGIGVNPITVTPVSLDFGEVGVGVTSAPLAVTVTNTSDDPFGPINIFGGEPPSAEFGASQNCQGATLAAGGTCTVTYTFTPTGTGPFTDSSAFTISATASASAGEDFVVSLAGCGAPCAAAPTPTPTPTATATATPAPSVMPSAPPAPTDSGDEGEGPGEGASPTSAPMLPDTAGPSAGGGVTTMLVALLLGAILLLLTRRLAERGR